MLLAAAALTLLAVLAADPGGRIAAVDRAVSRWFVAHRTSGWTGLFRPVTDLGDGSLLIAVGAAVVLLLVWRPPRAWLTASCFAAANLGASGLSRSLKVVVDRPRPPHDTLLVAVDSPSFPSGHATQAAAFWGGVAVLVLLSNRPTRQKVAVAVASGAVVVLVGVSRVYLGAHWASDVAGSYLLVVAWFSVLAAAPRRDSPAGAYRWPRSGGGARLR